MSWGGRVVGGTWGWVPQVVVVVVMLFLLQQQEEMIGGEAFEGN